MVAAAVAVAAAMVVSEKGEETDLVERWKVEGDGGGGRRI